MVDNIITINNLKIINNEHVLVNINPKIYSLDVIQSSAYILMDRAYIVIDGNPQKKILVELKPINKKENLETLGRDFNNELLNYAVYKIQSERTKTIREQIVRRALFTNLGEEANSLLEQNENTNKDLEEYDEEEIELPKIEENNTQNYEEDPENIMIPWDKKKSDKEKNGNKY